MAMISATIDLKDLPNFATQAIPVYITQDNTTEGNVITDEGATLGRVLFYDKNLSVDNSIACASCHKQEFAFGDTARASKGVAGVTGRHSMRLINTRFAREEEFFWDERAATLEEQSTMPIKDHVEMGFSGTLDDPDFDDLIEKLSKIDYYNQLFHSVYGDTVITEERMQKALAQFIRSIQSFDSRYDAGRSRVGNSGAQFPNFTPDENAGKSLFIARPQFDSSGRRIAGGAGCQACHGTPEFDIAPNSRNNGVVSTIANKDVVDFTIGRSPTLRDMFNQNGGPNGPFMHNAMSMDIRDVIDHYDSIVIDENNPRLDPRLSPFDKGQRLGLSDKEKSQLIAFLKTLSGSDVYTNDKWSSPFDENGNLTILNGTLSVAKALPNLEYALFPNPVSEHLTITGEIRGLTIQMFSKNGQLIKEVLSESDRIDISVGGLPAGIYIVNFSNGLGVSAGQKKIIVQH